MKTKKINLYKYTLKRKCDTYGRERLRGVFHVGGYQIASDNHLMCRIKTDYPAEMEGKIVDKKGQIIPEKYDDWRLAIRKTAGSKLLKIDLISLRKRAQEGLDQIKSGKLPVLVAINGADQDAYFEAGELAKFLEFFDFYPDCKIYYAAFNRPLKAANRNGDLCLIMPRDVDVYKGDCTIVDYPREVLPVTSSTEPSAPETTIEKTEETTDADPVSPKTDGIVPGTTVVIPAGDPDYPYRGLVVRCYELGPVPQQEYAVIVRLNSEMMEMGAVRKVYPNGLMLCLNTELQILSEPDGTYQPEDTSHFIERCLSLGWTLTGNMVCGTGQTLYIFEPRSRQEEMSMAVREDGRWDMLYSNRRGTYSKRVTQWLINGY